MTTLELYEALHRLVEAGHGDLPVFIETELNKRSDLPEVQGAWIDVVSPHDQCQPHRIIIAQ